MMIVTVLAATLAACATDRSFGLAPGIEVTELTALPAPRGETLYTIGPQEKLEIFVVGAEELSGTYLTDEEGNLVFPLLGRVEIGQRRPSEASAIIADRLRGRYLLDPQVRVIPEELPPPSISIGGEVKRPGSYPAAGQPTLMQVINQAEGLTEYAESEDVLIMRTVDGQRYIGLYNVGAIRRGNADDPRLYADDLVMVGDSPARRRLDDILQLVPLSTPLVVLLNRI